MVSHPAFLATAGVLLAVWFLARDLEPVIERVPVVAPGGALMIEGRGFGSRQGNSSVFVAAARRRSDSASEPNAWGNERVSALAPGVGGTVQVLRKLFLFTLKSNAVPFVVPAPDLPSKPYGYGVPVEPKSPWPTFRHDHRNTGRSNSCRLCGRSAVVVSHRQGRLLHPVIDGDGTVYVGSADHTFYAINPDGSQKWAVETGEIIDSAAALPRSEGETDDVR